MRSYNARLGCYDYIKDGRYLVLRTHPAERSRFIFQLGTADPDLALRAALTVHQDVRGIDVNCGCPKTFSTHAGMGSALLRQPDRLVAILSRLVGGLAGLGVAVTAKIRVLPCPEETLALVRRIRDTGVHGITVHCRFPHERPRDPAHWELIPAIAKAIHPIPLTANGDLFTAESIRRALQLEGVSSVMLARGAQWNPTIFRWRREGKGDEVDGHSPYYQQLLQATQDYLGWAVRVENLFGNTKYALLQIWIGPDQWSQDANLIRRARSIVPKLQAAKTYAQLYGVFGWESPRGAAVIATNHDSELEEVLDNA